MKRQKEETNERIYSGNVSENAFYEKTDRSDPICDRDGICPVMAGTGRSGNGSVHQHESGDLP